MEFSDYLFISLMLGAVLVFCRGNAPLAIFLFVVISPPFIVLAKLGLMFR